MRRLGLIQLAVHLSSCSAVTNRGPSDRDDSDKTIGQGSNFSRFRRAAQWMFVNRRTGAITIAQWPNVALSVFIGLSIAQRFTIPKGIPKATLRLF